MDIANLLHLTDLLLLFTLSNINRSYINIPQIVILCILILYMLRVCCFDNYNRFELKIQLRGNLICNENMWQLTTYICDITGDSL